VSQAAERHRQVCQVFTARVAGTADWDAPSPVPEWAARDVVAHLVEWLPAFLLSGTGIHLIPADPSAAEPSAADPNAADPVAAWTAQADAVQALLEDPDTAGRLLTNPHIGEIPLDRAIDNFYTTDVFLHTWDLARATGQDDCLDADACADLLAGMEPLDAMLRASGQYGPRVPVPADADAQSRLFAFIGRDPNWRPPHRP